MGQALYAISIQKEILIILDDPLRQVKILTLVGHNLHPPAPRPYVKSVTSLKYKQCNAPSNPSQLYAYKAMSRPTLNCQVHTRQCLDQPFTVRYKQGNVPTNPSQSGTYKAMSRPTLHCQVQTRQCSDQPFTVRH